MFNPPNKTISSFILKTETDNHELFSFEKHNFLFKLTPNAALSENKTRSLHTLFSFRRLEGSDPLTESAVKDIQRQVSVKCEESYRPEYLRVCL